MDKLVIPLATIPEAGLPIDAVLDCDQTEGVSVGPIRVEGNLEPIDSEYLFRGTLSGAFRGPCDRCLGKGERPYALDVVWFFEPNGDAEELGAGETFEVSDADVGEPPRHIDGSELDLGEHVLEEVQLTIPSKFLCKDDCKGLCPRCGANLNEGPCACPAEAAVGHPGLANLAEMFPNLKRDN